MKRFSQLYTTLDQTNRTSEKVAAMESYFREAGPRDAAWALYFLRGRRLPRTVTSTALREWATAESGFPPWLVEECYDTVGDLGETLALLLPENTSSLTLPLHELVEERILPMQDGSDAFKRDLLIRTWRELNARERYLFNKLLTGGFRVGVAQTLVVHALATVAGVERPVMAHRLMGKWKPGADDFLRLLRSDSSPSEPEPAKPYPFYLASPLEGSPEELGDLREWLVEWKWDGIRAQLIRRRGEAIIWSRGDEMVTAAFPEIAEAAMALPEGTVVDGEILAWQNDAPLPFTKLQRRLGRKQAGSKTRRDFPVVFLAYDLLEWESEDWRSRPMEERRLKLEDVIGEAARSPLALHTGNGIAIGETMELFPPDETSLFPLHISPLIHAASWEELAAMQKDSRARGVEGLMLKRRSSPAGVGRQRGNMWKWKIDPLVIDAVLIAAQSGHGRRANLYTDYTFGVWQGEELVPIAKAYSGLDDSEILQVDKFIRANTTGKFGPVRAVKAELVFELAFEAVQESTRHKTGIAVRFPRINRWRHDKKPGDADTLENLRKLMRTAPV